MKLNITKVLKVKFDISNDEEFTPTEKVFVGTYLISAMEREAGKERNAKFVSKKGEIFCGYDFPAGSFPPDMRDDVVFYLDMTDWSWCTSIRAWRWVN